MRTLDTRFGLLPTQDAAFVTFTEGLPGFEGRREFALVPLAEHPPFYCMQDLHDATLSFVVADPSTLKGFDCPVPQSTDLRALKIEHPGDLWLLVLASRDEVHGLRFHSDAPIAINRRTQLGRQCGLQISSDSTLSEPASHPTLQPACVNELEEAPPTQPTLSTSPHSLQARPGHTPRA